MTLFANMLALAISVFTATNCETASPSDNGKIRNSSEPVAADAIPVPPARHPRLYLQNSDVPELRTRLEHPTAKKVLRAMEKIAPDRTPAEEAAETDRGFRYYAKMRGLTTRAQLQALDYLVYGRKSDAREAITTVLDSLKHTDFGTENDLSRASGIMLMVGGMVYDWCYDQMTADEKQAYIKEFIRIAGTMECGYPPKNTESIAGHPSEWMILRDMLSCGIAIYDEYPDMYNYVMKMLVEKYRPARQFVYSGQNYHQGTSYVNVRFSNDMIAQWILKRMGAGDFFDKNQQYVMYDVLYRRRPDGSVLPAGDTNHNRNVRNNYALPCFLAASYYGDPYLQWEFEQKQGIDAHCYIFRLLWQDFNLKGISPEELPLSRYSGSPYGWMIARTGWDENSVVAEMKVNENFVGNHQHLDGGSFQFYYKGPLALDTGMYQGTDGGYNCPNNKNYTKRTIAHNSLLVYDPDEVFECYNYGGADQTQFAANDGGQRMPGDGWKTCNELSALQSDEYTVGKTLAHGMGPNPEKPDYTYLKGDITKAYTSKVRDVRRSFVFLNMKESDVPAVMITFDHIVAANPAFKKYWLFHSIEEPEIDGSSFTVKRTLDGETGMVRCDMLFPDAEISKVGGEGHEFDVFGTNYPTYPTESRPDPTREYGQWRIQETPVEAAAEDIFLNVMQISDTSVKTLKDVSRIDSPTVAGAVVGDRVVTFCKNGEAAGKEISFVIPDTGQSKLKILITDLSAGSWKVSKDGIAVRTFKVNGEDGCIYLTSGPGEYKITMK